MITQENPKTNNQGQQGFVLIIVVSILTVIIALIATGFSRLSDRELRQASNRELSAQAYYAAQSGINDAMAYIKDGGASFNTCNGWPPAGDYYFTKDLSDGNNIAKYSCITVDSTPKVLNNQQVAPGQPWIVKINASNLKSLYIGWENYGNPSSPAFFDPAINFGTLPDETSSGFFTDPNQTGVLRAQIYRIPRDGSIKTNVGLGAESRAYYLYPDKGSGTINCISLPQQKHGCVDYNLGGYSPPSGSLPGGLPAGENGNFVSGRCQNNGGSNPKPDPSGTGLAPLTYCNSEITGLDGGINYYYLYFTARYTTLNVVVKGTDSLNNVGGNPAGNPVQFIGGQSVIDVTGQAAGQTQRVRVRVGASSELDKPDYALQSMETLCKAFVLQIPQNNKYAIGQSAGYSNDPSDCAPPPTGDPSGDPIQGIGKPGHTY